MGDIAGIQEFASGAAEHIAGVKALDEHTLQITIDAPKPYFLMKLTYPNAFVVDKENVESGEEWYRQPNGTGPYKLIEWTRFERMVYEANSDFYLGVPSIPFIVVNLYSGYAQQLYETGDVDIAGVYSIERFTDPTEPLHSELLTGVSLCTSYVIFDSLIYQFTGFGFVDSLGALGLIYFSVNEGKESFEKAAGLETCCDDDHCETK